MTLASFSDANSWLDATRIKFADDTDALPEATNADSIVLGRLAGSYSDYFASWDTPAHTPTAVRTVAAMLMAAYRYARKYSAESVRANSYAVWLEKKATELLDQLANSVILLWDVIPLPTGDSFTSDDFYPNDATGVLDDTVDNMLSGADNDVKFTMGDVY